MTKKLQEAHKNAKQVLGELTGSQDSLWLDTLDLTVDNCLAEAAEYCEDRSNLILKHGTDSSTKQDVVSSQLKRIEIPVFQGNKENYFHWKSAFKSCIDSSSVSDEIKLLHLYQ